MIGSRWHIELNGVKYRLYEQPNGGHYQRKGEPLRPPHAVLEMAGDPYNPRYQMRPDLLVWGISDWSGGEGQIKLQYDTGDRHWRLNCVEVFEWPGKLMPGPYVEECVVVSGETTATLEKSVSLVPAAGKLWALDLNDHYAYEWDPANLRFKVAVDTGAAAGCTGTCAGHAKYFVFKENNSDNIWKFDGTTAVKINDDTSCSGASSHLYRVDHYAYLHQVATGRVWEIDLEAAAFPAASVLLDDPKWDDPDSATLKGTASACQGDNCLYTLMAWNSGCTVIRKITPTTAAGPGFGKEILRIQGFIGESIWFHSGILYFSGYEDLTNRFDRALLYLKPGGEYGTLGPLRQGDHINSVVGGPFAQRMLDFGFAGGAATTALDKPTLFTVSAVTGGQCVYGYASVYSGAANTRPQSIASFDGAYFFSTKYDAATKRIFRTSSTKYEPTNAYAISSWHDFALVDDKVLESIRIHTEALPASWDVVVSYAFDGSTSFTTAGTYTTDNGTGTTYVISSSGSIKTFKSMQVKIQFTWKGEGIPTTRPVVLAVEARASVAGSKGPTTWKLLLDCADDVSQEGGQSYSGYAKITNLLTAYSTGVVSLKDGYRSEAPNVYTTHSVVVDEYTLDVEKPGEGQALVVLREVT